MNKTLAKTAPALVAIALFAASAAPASAGGFSFGFGGYGPTPWYPGPYGGVYIEVDPKPSYASSWDLHVAWCLDHYETYNPATNKYKTKYGKKFCNSPYL